MDYSALTDSQQQQQQQQQYQYEPQQQQQAYTPTHTPFYDSYAYHHYHPHDPSASSAYPPPDVQPTDAAAMDGAPQQGAAYELPPGLNPAAAAAVAALSQLSQFAGTMDAAERAMVGAHHMPPGTAAGGPPLPTPPPHHHHYPQTHHAYPYHLVQHVFHHGVGGRPPYKGGGRQGSGTFRGRARGNCGAHPRPDRRAPPFRGRGRGRGQGRMGRTGGRQSDQSAAADTQTPYPAPEPGPMSVVEPSPAPAMESSSTGALLQASAQAQAQAPTTLAAAALPKLPLLPLAWCDICRVDCNSLEILEQHKNGKRHKRTVQRIQEIQARQKLVAELQAKVTGNSGMIIQAGQDTVAALVGEANKTPAASKQQSLNIGPTQPANLGPANEALAAEIPSEVPPSTDVPPSEAPPTEPLPRRRMDGSDKYNKRYGPKRNMTRLGRGGKRMKYSEALTWSRPPERPKEQPRVCTLCNVMCDTLPTFEAHLAGKKHVSRIKRFQGQGMVYGPVSVYIPPNQPTGFSPQSPEPLFFGLTTPEIIQQGVHVHAGMSMEGLGHQQNEQPGESSQAKDGVQEIQVEQKVNHRGNGVVDTLEDGQNSTKSQASELGPSPETATVKAEVNLAVGNGVPVPECVAFPAEDAMLPGVKTEEPSAVQDFATDPSKHAEVKAEQSSFTNVTQEYGVFPAEVVPLSALDVKVEEPKAVIEGLGNGENVNFF